MESERQNGNMGQNVKTDRKYGNRQKVWKQKESMETERKDGKRRYNNAFIQLF